MVLDNLIRNRNTSQSGRWRGLGQGRGRGRGGPGGTIRGRGIGMLNRGPLRVNTRPSPYKIAKSFSRTKDMTQRHDLFGDSMVAAGIPGVETGTKLYISNLDYGVSNQDIRELFSEVGDLKRFAVHYDRNGRPSGSAEVVYARRSDAIAALKRYNNVLLDGKPMKIEIIGTNLGLPTTPRVNVAGGSYGRGRRTVVMTPQIGQGGSSSSSRFSRMNQGSGPQHGRGRGRGSARGGGRGAGAARGRGGRGMKPKVKKSAEELDKELDKYHAQGMDTS
ncbi:THO complex subunit 4D-like isoform X1 [Zingiber officinale]|uniref:THO complex subunit 4D-like isoform X1 n=1 Tax=Zingiber officinale TaxID=94328 RepID=UPI001C4AF22A|nr:THO complex subunit 4D-like isoform X1 [Zingiber officinale]